MREVDYNIIAFDAQYFLHRNFAALQSRTKVNLVDYIEGDSTGYLVTDFEFTYQDLVRQFFWTIGKFIRDRFSCNKIILLWDRAPYHKTKLLPDFKGTRCHACIELLEEIDPKESPEEWLQMKVNIKMEEIKSRAKYWIIDNLDSFGMPSVICDGWEADDLANIFSNNSNIINGSKKSAIVSCDSDWMFWISSNVDYINFNKNEAWTYEDVQGEYSYMDKTLGISLFKLKQYMDSTFYSHNDLIKTTNLTMKQFPQLYNEIQLEDYTHITDVERLKKNLKSFEYWDYPNYKDAEQAVEAALKSYSDLSMEKYNNLVINGFLISKSYASNYLQTLTKEYYELPT